MTVTDTELLGYLDATDALRCLSAAVPKWLRQRVLEDGQAVCWHCESAPPDPSGDGHVSSATASGTRSTLLAATW